MSLLFNFANKAPIFFELSSISRFLAGFARGPPNASDVSLKSLVKVVITGLCGAGAHDEKEQNMNIQTNWITLEDKSHEELKKVY